MRINLFFTRLIIGIVLLFEQLQGTLIYPIRFTRSKK